LVAAVVGGEVRLRYPCVNSERCEVIEMEGVDGVSSGNGADGGYTDAEVEEAFEGIAFGILDAVVLGPMRSEILNMDEEDQSSSTYF
jgi:hypothetical protein